MTDDTQRESENKGKQKQEEREELLEKVQKARDGRLRHQQPAQGDDGQVSRPPPNDPRFGDTSVPPEQADVPAGGTTGGAMGTSSKRKKDHPG